MSAADSTYFSTVAQVIPVLLVLIAVDLKLYEADRQWTPGAALVLMSVLILLLAGEALSLNLLHSDRKPTAVDQAVITGGLIWAGGLVLVQLIRPVGTAVMKHGVGYVFASA